MVGLHAVFVFIDTGLWRKFSIIEYVMLTEEFIISLGLRYTVLFILPFPSEHGKVQIKWLSNQHPS